MGLFDLLRGSAKPALTQLPDIARHVGVDKLAVHTAEEMVIITGSVQVAGIILDAAHNNQAAVVAGPNAQIVLVPTKTDDLPVHDPNNGWLLPLSPELRSAILNSLRPQACAVELTKRVGIVIE
ncbi:hypothetical protein QPX09_00445 [Corynebacterium pseudodiphtheriticum]|uniref:hypothetical protein n=1 Tax=Corynebacterium pseudodiphtheriticum TaxID=37637 RepID=UPI00254298C6|nr:hypothetical protein [Corynebacterium pseudodiphtheriticum]MDK4236057.1 hypothetical protein [Corynebacterium pseudodiphtheriticum]